jgi:LmbE family N-acetylglucosaminyl deacetylase
MLQESDIIPYHLSHAPGERAIVLAPHPDDETLGCGGTIRLLLKSKRPVKVIFLTSGEKADPSNSLSHIVPSPLAGEGKGEGGSHITDYSLMREKEAVRALKVLGVSDYEFLRFPDRELNLYYKSALDRLLEIIGTYMPDTIYSPSMIELNPDHRTTAALSMEIQRIVMNTDEALAKVSNEHPPQPLPSREGFIYQPSPLAGEPARQIRSDGGKGEGDNGLLQEAPLISFFGIGEVRIIFMDVSKNTQSDL